MRCKGRVKPGCAGRSCTQRHGVKPRHHAGSAGEVAFHKARKQNIAGSDTGAGKGGSKEQQWQRAEAAQRGAQCQKQQHCQQRTFGTDALCQPWRERGEDAKADNGQGRQNAGAER